LRFGAWRLPLVSF